MARVAREPVLQVPLLRVGPVVAVHPRDVARGLAVDIAGAAPNHDRCSRSPAMRASAFASPSRQARCTACTPRKTPFSTMLSLTSRSEEHTSELQSLMRISYAVFCLKKKKTSTYHATTPK